MRSPDIKDNEDWYLQYLAKCASLTFLKSLQKIYYMTQFKIACGGLVQGVTKLITAFSTKVGQNKEHDSLFYIKCGWFIKENWILHYGKQVENIYIF